jgi:rhodanese-related sulfurtransferase
MHLAILCLLIFSPVVGVHAESERATFTITQQELLQRLDARVNVLILDVRTPQEFATSHIPGAVNVPHTSLPKRLNDVRPYQDKEVIVYCETGFRAGIAAQVLHRAGFTHVRHLEGDMALWRRISLPIETSAR